MAEERRALEDLEQRADFVRRHVGPSDAEIAEMLKAVGFASLDALMDKAIPRSILARKPMRLDKGLTEAETLGRLREMADANRAFRSMIGMGYYDTFTPPVILRNVLESPGWYTAYTPYQPEISQGRLEALLNFQTMVMELTAMDLANASMLDEATAAAEAMTLCHRVGRDGAAVFFVAADCHPQTIAVVRTRAEALGLEVVVGDPLTELAGKDVFGVLLQYPTTEGAVHDYAKVAEAAHAREALVVVAADLLSLALLKPPGEWGADVVVGSAQRFGVPLGFGGPHAGFFATRDAYRRSVPGRLVGVSVDRKGRMGLRLALQTREQHIRREKATSNICTAQVLLANMAGFYAVWHGPEGIRTIAARVHRYAAALARELEKAGFELAHGAFFDTLAVRAKGKAGDIVKRAAKARINLRPIDKHTVGLSLDETTTRADLEQLLRVFAGRKAKDVAFARAVRQAKEAIPRRLRRASAFLTHPVFSSYRSETEMLRYLRRLQEKDIALDRAMIPLGSCTMKLNATAEMLPVTWPGFARIHPYAPSGQVKGYARLIGELEDWLCRITGFAAVSLQPNAGSQGEYAGLLAIRGYHRSRGEGRRRVCLIPSSAHGTNPASAVLAGMTVVVVACDKNGNVDVADLRAKAEAHRKDLAALMITYPSTHGVFEERIVEICRIVHDNGGQVYMDGANLNALVGYCKPAEFGADVAHLNLHKTFCIPHGGGGPGVGPIGVRKHLARFLPGHPLGGKFRDKGAPVAAAPWGSAGILPISWAYIALMGGDGLRKATQVAILNANYVAKRLARHYPVLYEGPGGLCAHECIVDPRALKQSAGVEAEDIAKRLIDFGFHAPTMSFPVAGTLMIEPTESESKAELDRFCDAMIAIREEARAIEEGRMDRADNPLKNAPHAAEDLVADDWPHAYPRRQAAFPVESLRLDKYWPPVGRIDNVYGDRHLVCACPPLEAYKEAAE